MRFPQGIDGFRVGIRLTASFPVDAGNDLADIFQVIMDHIARHLPAFPDELTLSAVGIMHGAFSP
jgi:hypothetical protein